jgi:hypothetical protein
MYPKGVFKESTMPIEPPGKINETQIIRREEGATMQQKKKQTPEKKNQIREPEKSGKIDIKI